MFLKVCQSNSSSNDSYVSFFWIWYQLLSTVFSLFLELKLTIKLLIKVGSTDSERFFSSICFSVDRTMKFPHQFEIESLLFSWQFHPKKRFMCLVQFYNKFRTNRLFVLETPPINSVFLHTPLTPPSHLVGAILSPQSVWIFQLQD